MTSDGQPYGPYRYKQIVRELYGIAKNTSTPYTELLNITPTERDYLVEFIMEEAEKTKEMIEQRRSELQ